MTHRVYVIAAEYSAPLIKLSRTPIENYRAIDPDEAAESEPAMWRKLFFSAPGLGQTWTDLGAATPPSLSDLLASAAHRALGSLHQLCGSDDYIETCWAISDLLVASMPMIGTIAGANVNAGLIPLMLRAALGLDFNCHCQFVAGTADSGASAFASAVRIAQSRPATVLVAAGQLMPSGYTGQYRIRSVFTPDEQSDGLDMMALGDALMDALRRTHADAGYDVGQCQDWLAQVRDYKVGASRAYPAAQGVSGTDPGSGDRFVTRYFRSADVAKAGCGAAAVIVTSDPTLLGRIRRNNTGRTRRATARYHNTPVVEVVGVGEGTTNPRVLVRRSPLVGLSSVRQALAAAADDAALPLSVFPDSAFAVLHDAFPSMELAFLLAIGLDWQRSSLRMATWWTNPFGGLLTFGDAIGASGLVQLCKAYHVFTGDHRYIQPALNPIRRFRNEGSYAFTGSVGGPFSHIVVSILRGGVPLTERDQTQFFARTNQSRESSALATTEMLRRTRMRRAAQLYIERLAAHDDELWLIEGVTEMDARSCAQAIEPELIDALGLERLTGLVRAEHIDHCRSEAIALIHRLRSMYLDAHSTSDIRTARQSYSEGLSQLIDRWSERNALLPDSEIHDHLSRSRFPPEPEPEPDDLTAIELGTDSYIDAAPLVQSEQPITEALRQRRLKAIKQCIRVPAALLIEPGQFSRRLCFMPRLGDIDRADFVRFSPDRGLTMHCDDTILPWWNGRAVRGGDGDAPAVQFNERISPDPEVVFDALMTPARAIGSERPAELAFLRAYFAPAGPQAAVDLAMRDLGVMPEVDPELRAGKQVPTIFYKNDIIGSSRIADVHEAYELLGRAVQRARGWFGMYASTCAQHGDSVSLVSLDHRLERLGGDEHSEARHARSEAVSNASRFARDVAEWCLGYGIRLRTVVSFGHGMPYRDVNDDRSVASDSAIRGARLLDYVAREAHKLGYAQLPWIAFDLTELGDLPEAVDIFERELGATSGPSWRRPDGPPSPVALDRWDDIPFTVWYRPHGE